MRAIVDIDLTEPCLTCGEERKNCRCNILDTVDLWDAIDDLDNLDDSVDGGPE